MEWKQILDVVPEIIQLQEEIKLKLASPILKEIVNKRKKYSNLKNLKSLNNAVLENQLKNTPYQMIILEKINTLLLPIDSQAIYMHMPKKQEEAEKYVIELKQRFVLGNACFDLIMDIERISEIEYKFTDPVENSTYAKMVELETKLFSKFVNNQTDSNNLTTEIQKNKVEYVQSLSKEEKQSLLIEFLSLSYDRNQFDYFSGLKTIIQNSPSESQITSYEEAYNAYNRLILSINLKILMETPLQEVYNYFKLIYETDFFKQKLKKKYV